jgi:putative transcriptional regulator
MHRMSPWLLTILALLVCRFGAAAEAPAAGRLLVATEQLSAPEFAQSVVLLLHYDSDGALGIVINRPTWVAPATAFPDDLGYMSDYKGHLYLGGPLARSHLLVLVRAPETPPTAGRRIVDDVYISTDPAYLRKAVGSDPDEKNLRLYAGHAAWQPGQLEQEIALGNWKVLPASADLVFSAKPLKLWQQVLSTEPQLIVQNSSTGHATGSADGVRLLR